MSAFVCPQCKTPTIWPPAEATTTTAVTEGVSGSALLNGLSSGVSVHVGTTFHPKCNCFVPCPLNCKISGLTFFPKEPAAERNHLSASSSSSSSSSSASSFSFDLVCGNPVLLPNDPHAIEHHLQHECVNALKQKNKSMQERMHRIAKQLQQLQIDLMLNNDNAPAFNSDNDNDKTVKQNASDSTQHHSAAKSADTSVQYMQVTEDDVSWAGKDQQAALKFLQTASLSFLANAAAHAPQGGPHSTGTDLSCGVLTNSIGNSSSNSSRNGVAGSSGSDDLLAYDKSAQRNVGGWAFGNEDAIPSLVHAKVDVSPEVRAALNMLSGLPRPLTDSNPNSVAPLQSLSASSSLLASGIGMGMLPISATSATAVAAATSASDEHPGDWSFGSLK